MQLSNRLVFVFAASLACGPAQQTPSQPSALMACGVHGDIEIFCGTTQPEDLELAPDGKFLIATRYLNQGRGGATDGGMTLFDLAKKTFTKMNVTLMNATLQAQQPWGDAECPGP